jgi:hypothetical protein
MFEASFFFKGNINQKIIHRQILPHYIYNIDTADHKLGDFNVEFLGEFESRCKNALTRTSGALMELFDFKKQLSKSCDAVPLKNYF